MLQLIDREAPQRASLPEGGFPAAAAMAETEVALAIIVPAFKHSVLLSEAIASAVAQEAPFGIAVLVVDDGCPYPETAAMGRAHALAHPNVYYLRKRNGGLSSARNYGIEFALRRFPRLEAVYFLDADNRLTPTAMREAMRFLRERPGIDWVYPNIDKFGIQWSGNYTTDYSRLLHVTFDNICEAGSLVSRRMLDAGIRFDESMKEGFEDWDFWLQALGRGFRGANHPFLGFEYRQRAESMLRDSNRSRQAIITYIQAKHRKLFATDTLLAWEHEEAPRFAGIGVGTDRVDLFTDPALPGARCDLDEFVRRYWAARLEPETFGVPPFLLWMSAPHRAALLRLGLLHNLLWLGERLSQQRHFIALRFENSSAAIELRLRAIGEEAPLADPPGGWMCPLDILSACVDDGSEDWARTLQKPLPSPKVTEIVVAAPFTAKELQGSALSPTHALFATLGALRESGYRRQEGRWIWRSVYLPNRSRYFQLLRKAADAGPIMPRIARKAAGAAPLRVGFLLPIATFGGVEKVAYAVARALKAAGCEVHLFVLGKPVYNRIPENDGVFATINFLAADYPLWGGPHSFAGHELLMGHDEAARTEELLGLLGGLDVVINNQVAPVNAALGALRRRGVKVLNYVHVLDQTSAGRAAGHPYLSLAFEHVHDLILTCSRGMAEWLHAMGIPDAKLLHIRNAASYALPAEDQQVAMAARRARSRERLRVLFLGRLDPQKGIQRLFAAARDIRRRGIAVDWRVIGADVMAEQGGVSWKARFAEIGIEVEPPVYASRHLNRAFAWADVLVLPSRWEGAPLTILEAQRLGCVPIATAVGAVEELVRDQVDGVLLQGRDDGAVTRALIAAIEQLLNDPTDLARLSEAAAARSMPLAWEGSVAPLLERLRAWFPERLPAERARPEEREAPVRVPAARGIARVLAEAGAVVQAP